MQAADGCQTKCPGDIFMISILQNKGKCWTEFYKYVKRHKGQNIPAVKDFNGRLITLISYYALALLGGINREKQINRA